MKNVITFIISSVILTLLVYLYFYATVGDDAMQEMETYKDWIAVSVILLSIAVAFVADRIRKRREDELDFGKPASRVTQSRVSQSTYQDNDHDNDHDSDTDYDHDVEESRVAQSEEDVDGYYNHTAFVRYEVGDDDEPYEDFVYVGVEDDEFDELSEAEYNGRYLDMDFIAENFSELHDRIIVAIRQRVMDEYYNLINSDHKNLFYPSEYPLNSRIDYDVLDLE